MTSKKQLIADFAKAYNEAMEARESKTGKTTYLVQQFFEGSWMVSIEANSPEEAKALGYQALEDGEGERTDFFQWLEGVEVMTERGEVIEVN